MRNLPVYYQEADVEFGYPSFPAYKLEEIRDHEFGYLPFPAYELDEDTAH